MEKIIHKFLFRASPSDIFTGKSFEQDGMLYRSTGHGYTTWGV